MAKWFLNGNKYFHFEPIENGTKTRFVHGEITTGYFSFLGKMMVTEKQVTDKFSEMNLQLKKEVESRSWITVLFS